jgi:hypothetical protein
VEIKRARVIASNLLPSDAAGPVFFEARDVSSELENVNVDAIADPTSTTLDGQGTLTAGLLSTSLGATPPYCAPAKIWEWKCCSWIS